MTVSGSVAALVEDRCDLAIGVIVQQPVDLGDDLGAGLVELGRVRVRRPGELSGRAAAQPHAQAPRGLGQRHVLDQQPRHPLALSVQRRRIVPQAGEVAGQREDSLALLVVQPLTRFGAAVLELALCLVERAKLGVPLRLQHVGHHPVVGTGLHEPLPRQVGFLAAAL